MKALIGIKEERLNRLRKNNLHTLEIITPDNVATSEELENGELVFITSEGKNDLTVESSGVIGEIKTKDVFRQKVNTLYDEVETLTVRLQVEHMDEGRVKNVLIKDLGVEVEIEKNLFVG